MGDDLLRSRGKVASEPPVIMRSSTLRYVVNGKILEFIDVHHIELKMLY